MIPTVVLVLLAVGFLAALARVVRGPSVADRATAADVCLLCAVSAICVVAVVVGEPALLTAALVATIVGFLATLSLARLVRREGS